MAKDSKAKKALTSALAVGLAAVMTVGGGTFAYLQGETEEVKNDFERNKVLVTLAETKGPNYEIIPGVTDDKDPKVTVDNTVDSFVFVEISTSTDTDKLVDYEIADGWTKLDSVNDALRKVYYREVSKDADVKEFSVLKADSVSYSPSLTNSSMTNSSGNLKSNVALTFKASAIQAEPFGSAENAWDQTPAEVSTRNEFVYALKDGKKEITFTGDVELMTRPEVITNDTVIDLNGNTLRSAPYKSTLCIGDKQREIGANVTIKNGTIESRTTKTGSTLHVEGDSDVVIDNCTIKSSGNQSFVIDTNGSLSDETTITITDSTITAPTVAGKKGYALYAPAGNITFKNCDVTGHVFICGGNVTLDGGTYTATGFNNQSKIWHKADTASYVSTHAGGTAYNMGDSVLVVDRRGDGYELEGVTIKNITFNTAIPLSDGTTGTSYAIKYVDNNNVANRPNRAPYVIENNTYNNQINGADPVMFIDKDGNDIVQ